MSGAKMSNLLDEINFTDLELAQVPITLGKPPKVIRCWLCEASVSAVNKFKTKTMSGVRFNKDGSPNSITAVGEAETHLVAQCLYYADEKSGLLRLDSNGDPDKRHLVPEVKILAWPSKLQKQLFTRLKLISDLEDKVEDTEEGLVKELDNLQAKLLKLRQDKSSNNGISTNSNSISSLQETPQGNEPCGTTLNSE